jgi:hypothetical protein
MKRLLLLLSLLFLTSCISYSVGTTARPVAPGKFQQASSIYVIPDGVETSGSDGEPNGGVAYASADWQGRWGLSEKSDLSLRVPAGSGVIATYKRLINGPNDPGRPAVSAIIGGGVVNFGNHAFAEFGLIASGAEDTAVPYGGIRTMHVVPFSNRFVRDKPTIGGFAGMKLRVSDSFSISPEVGVYHDDSALGLRERDMIVVPSVTLHWH